MVSDEDCWSGGTEDVLGIVHLEDDAGGEAHDLVESSGYDPLCDLLLADNSKQEGDDDTEEGDCEEGDVGGEGASNEASFRMDQREHVEDDGDGEIADENVV